MIFKSAHFREEGHARDDTIGTGGYELVDFAVSPNIQYIEFDAGWYGDQDDEAADATKVNVDARVLNANPEYRGLDLHKVINYANSKSIGVILYINHIAMERQLDAILPLYKRWEWRASNMDSSMFTPSLGRVALRRDSEGGRTSPNSRYLR
jgi:hypothetical protein